MSKKKKHVPLTDEQYVAKGGGVCPVCKSTQIEGGSVEVDGATAFQNVSCNACQATWTDNYTLNGYNNLETTE